MRGRAAAAVTGAAVALAGAGTVVAAVAQGWSLDRALQAFVVSNLAIGLGFGLCGAVIAWYRSELALGWLFAAGGLAQTLSALAAPLAGVLQDAGAPEALVRADLTVFAWAWPVNIGVVLPVSLLLLPDGRLPSARWRPVAIAVVATAPLFVLELGLAPADLPRLPTQFGALGDHAQLSWLWTVSEVRWLLSVLVGLASLVVRHRRGSELVRRQLRWLLAAVGTLVVAMVPWALVAGTPLVALFAIPLLPVAIAVAVLRHGLLDIRLLVSRAVAYALLTGLVLAGYALLVVVLSGVVSALLVALAALPVQARLQRAVDRLLYGDRGDPLQVASRVGRSLGAGPAGTLEEIRAALRLPGVAVEVDGAPVAVAGTLTGPLERLPLADGSLVVALRSGQTSLDPADARVLALVTGPLSSAVAATLLSEQLQVSRERLVLAREEERRRLRRDLHDGLGPLLTGVALSADTAANLLAHAPDRAAATLGAVRTDSRTAIAEVRRIVEDLRPPALDELGLVEVLRTRAARTTARSDGAPLLAVVEATGPLPPLPAAVEVAAYRIATEALTNVVRHSAASHVVVRLTCDDDLHLEVCDDGPGDRPWPPGVGLTSMHERVAELGGHCRTGPGPGGGRVHVALPLARAAAGALR